jgi:hypothetical protein
MMCVETEFFILLTQGQIARVDGDDFERLRFSNCFAMFDPLRKSYLAARSVYREDGKKTTMYLAREIMGLVAGDERQVDHINHDTLDNRKENLRVVTKRQNIYNRRKKSDGSAPYKGISNQHGKWRARITAYGVTKDLGGFDTPEEARDVYRAAAKKLHGEFACFE